MTVAEVCPAPPPQNPPVLGLRVLTAADADQLGALFGRLSPRSRRMRYFAPVRRLSADSVRHLAAIDHDSHEAVGVFAAGCLVGAAHYFRRAGARSAEICIEVADDHQRRGLGSWLVAELATLARSRGVTEFTATALAENTAVRAMLHRLDRPAQMRLHGSELSVAVPLADVDR